PKSPYIEVFKEKYFSEDQIILNLKDNLKEVKPTSAIYTGSKNELKVIQIHEKNNIADLVRNQFPKKTVLVDMWATWCSPCIKEFTHKKELNSFLVENGVEMLYVSIDKEKSYEKWKSAVIEHDLVGNHFFATDNLTDFFPKGSGISKNITIPRYLLFDTNGNILDDNVPRPSSGKTEQKLLELLN
ncbi:TlpA family protein disulfide reductase, partial [Robertkochia marina]